MLNIHIFHPWQVAHRAGDGHIALVFDCSGFRTGAHPQVGIFGICPEGNKQDVHFLLSQYPSQFRKFHIIAN